MHDVMLLPLSFSSNDKAAAIRDTSADSKDKAMATWDTSMGSVPTPPLSQRTKDMLVTNSQDLYVTLLWLLKNWRADLPSK